MPMLKSMGWPEYIYEATIMQLVTFDHIITYFIGLIMTRQMILQYPQAGPPKNQSWNTHYNIIIINVQYNTIQYIMCVNLSLLLPL